MADTGDIVPPYPQPNATYKAVDDFLPIIPMFETAHPGYDESNWWEYFWDDNGTMQQTIEFRNIKTAYTLQQALRVVEERTIGERSGAT